LDSFRNMGRLAPGLVLALGLIPGCSFDWTIGGTEGGSDGGGRDASLDTHVPPADTGMHDTGTHETSAADVVDSASEDALSCAALVADVETARSAAVACPPPSAGDCGTHVTDQCGCIVYVAQPSSTQTDDYKLAISRLLKSGCSLGCNACGSPPKGAACLVSGDAGHLMDVCTPF
jgi:hypothetical protein